METQNFDIKNLSFQDLIDLKNQVEQQISINKEQELVSARQMVLELADNLGLSIADFVAPLLQKKKFRKPSSHLYRNPDDFNQTWTGHGRKPGWLVAAIASGRQLEDFKIPA